MSTNLLLPHGLLLADGWVSLGLFMAGVAVLTLTLLQRQQRSPRRRRNPEPVIDAQPRPTSEWDRVEADPLARVERAKVELESYRRNVVAEVDTKLLLLQELIAQSQQQIQRMEELMTNLPDSKAGKTHQDPS